MFVDATLTPVDATIPPVDPNYECQKHGQCGHSCFGSYRVNPDAPAMKNITQAIEKTRASLNNALPSPPLLSSPEEFVISPSPGTGRLPVVITLPHVKPRVLDAPADFLVQGIIDAYTTLAACFEHLDRRSRQEFFLGLPLLFFLDSVDELSDAPAIANVNWLYNPRQWRESVFVITCRSDVFPMVLFSRLS